MNEELPPVEMTHEEIRFLQEMIDREVEVLFNYHMDCLDDKYKDREALSDYKMAKEIRKKLYHMTGRDTLAPGYHEQRWWDQQHDY